MAAQLSTILTGLEKPETTAAPISTTGPALSSALEPWAARHNHEIWQTGPDGTYAWRNQADGTFDDSDPADIAITDPNETTHSA